MLPSNKKPLWIVGGTQGIGKHLFGCFQEEFQVHSFSRREGFDFSDESVVRDLLVSKGSPFAWIHCPGSFLERPLLETEQEEWEILLRSNLWSFLAAAKILLPAMGHNGGGRVLAFGAASLKQRSAKLRGPAYFAVKEALFSVVQSLAKEWAPKRVLLNLISPGLISHEHSAGESQERMKGKVPLGRLGNPDDLEGLVRLLLSPQGEYFVGQELVVDGGLSL
jgi:NAD(P)-dependent dehydrogenase (short-subunit alcohol dehydrogenase family)